MDLQIRVPATVANLGPGFDCLGVAIGLHLQITVRPSDTAEVVGQGTVKPLPENLIYRSFVSAFAAAGGEAPPVRIEIQTAYPSARGMGASASAIVAGIVAARSLGDLALSDADLAKIAIRIEGHGDNVLPAFFGGLVLNSSDGWMRFKPTDEIAPIVLTAAEKFKTDEARKILPDQVPIQDAVANAAATAALVAVLTGQAPTDSLLVATQDRLHEPYRLPLMGVSNELRDKLRKNGIATALSGAGPSLMCLVPVKDFDESLRFAQTNAPAGWGVLTPGWDLTGAEAR